MKTTSPPLRRHSGGQGAANKADIDASLPDVDLPDVDIPEIDLPDVDASTATVLTDTVGQQVGLVCP